MSATQSIFVVALAAVLTVCFLVRVALVVYVVVIALNTSSSNRRRVALDLLRVLSPALSVKLGLLAITRGEAPPK